MLSSTLSQSMNRPEVGRLRKRNKSAAAFNTVQPKSRLMNNSTLMPQAPRLVTDDPQSDMPDQNETIDLH
jgi:hypothetical protein